MNKLSNRYEKYLIEEQILKELPKYFNVIDVNIRLLHPIQNGTSLEITFVDETRNCGYRRYVQYLNGSGQVLIDNKESDRMKIIFTFVNIILKRIL